MRLPLAFAVLALAACSGSSARSSSTMSAGSGGAGRGGAGSASSTSSTSAGTGGAGGGDAGPDAPASTGSGSLVSVSGYQIIVRQRLPDGSLGAGAPWDMKGIAWSPTGAGEPFDGTGASFTQHAPQDVPLMSAAHINTVRTYGPLSRSAAGLGVLDALHAQGMMVAMTVLATYGDASYVQTVEAFKHHPAMLLWIVGNEWNYNALYSSHTHAECIQQVNAVAAAIRAQDPDHPVATGYGELPSAADYAAVSAVDLWALNIYPNLSFGNRFTRWAALAKKPFFVSEYGADAYDQTTMKEDQADQALALSSLTKEIRSNLSAKSPTGTCAGGCPFEWNDEWWKSGAPAVHDTAGFANQGVYPDGFANEEWWGIVDGNRTPRAAYTTLQGLYK